MQPKEWHWQERFEVLINPEDACRQQLLHIHNNISPRKWLLQKRKEKKRSNIAQPPDPPASHKDRAGSVAATEAEQEFKKWLRRKKKEKAQQQRQAKENTPTATPREGVEKTKWVKPPSLHVNPKINGRIRRKTEAKSSSVKKRISDKDTQERAAEAYSAWMKRIQREDRVKRQMQLEERARRDYEQLLLQENKWRKKLVVCAYSTNARR